MKTKLNVQPSKQVNKEKGNSRHSTFMTQVAAIDNKERSLGRLSGVEALPA